MSKFNLDQIKGFVEQLPPEQRIELFHHIANLPDSGIHTGSLSDPPYNITDEGQEQENFETIDDFVLIHSITGVTPIGVAVLLKGKTVFQVFYYPESFYNGRLKLKHSWQNAPPTDDMMSKIRSIIEKSGGKVSDEEIIKATKEATKQLFEAETFRITNELSSRLPDMVNLLVNAAIKIIEISIHKSFSENTGQFDKIVKLDHIEKALDPYWQHIKEKQLGITPGGARNYKHIWTPEDGFCLVTNYEKLLPIWIEAKKIAKAAQNSKEPTRSKRWREEVQRAYPELPNDLIERLSTPRSDEAKPANIALIHAASLCVSVKLSTRRLREEFKKWKSKMS